MKLLVATVSLRPALALKAAAACLLAAGLTTGLAGCGFTPLYATPGVSPALAAIKVEAPQSRTAYLIRQSLNDQLSYDPDTPARYRLTFVTTETRAPQGITINNVASRYDITLTVGYTLSDAVTGKVVLTGIGGPVDVSFDASTPPYASVIASQDGEARAAEQAAIRVRMQLARYFEHLAYPATPPQPLGAQLPVAPVEGPRLVPTPQTPMGLPGFGGSNLQPQVIDNPPPSSTPIDSTPAPASPQ
ncbi:MAG: LPS assembly lipoprotein LptE [Caulobacteraceae bacterium]